MIAEIRAAAVSPLWSDLDLTIDRGEFIAVLGPNGAGKSTLLAAILGARPLTSGSVTVYGRTGYIPQQRLFSPELPVRGRDLVALAAAPKAGAREDKARVDTLLAQVGAQAFANRRVGLLSGGEQQLIRQAQALATDPELLCADEPLLSLDPARERDTVRRLSATGAAVVCVTHTINPFLGVVDRVLYLGPNGHAVGTVADVMRSEVLSELYGTRVDVVEVDGRMVVL